MPELSRKQLEFFTFLIMICTVTAVLVLAIDFQIKAAILEESNRLRRALEEHEQKPVSANGKRSRHNRDNDVAYPGDMVPGRDARLETPATRAHSNGTSKAKTSPDS